MYRSNAVNFHGSVLPTDKKLFTSKPAESYSIKIICAH